MKKKKNIDDFSIGYYLFFWYEIFCARIFYRKIKVVNKDRIPRNKPMIFAMNHQNAVMDALVVLNGYRRNVLFLARGDAFKNPFILKLLTLFKMLPVYRMRDGIGELGKNEEIFQITTEVLSRKRCPVGLMPEGNHGNKRQLRPLVKGAFRIAFRAQEEYGEKDGVQIVPVGLDYEKYPNFRTKLLVNFGEPVAVNQFYKEYLEDCPRAINAIRSKLSEEMSKYMIDIRSVEFYDTYMNLRTIYNLSMRTRQNIPGKDLYSRFLADKEMIRILEKTEKKEPERIRPVSGKVKKYLDGVTELGLRDWLFKKNRYSYLILLPLSLGLLITFPFFLYGLINNIIPYRIPLLVTKKFKDPQFHSTVKFIVGLVIFPIWYLILFIIAWIFVEPGWIKWIYLVSLLPAGLFAHVWFIWLKKLRSMWKYSLLTSLKNKKIAELKILRSEIISDVDTIMEGEGKKG
jgi:1-acyl-sn-glycerol-3-phosphate acyltransferase